MSRNHLVSFFMIPRPCRGVPLVVPRIRGVPQSGSFKFTHAGLPSSSVGEQRSGTISWALGNSVRVFKTKETKRVSTRHCIDIITASSWFWRYRVVTVKMWCHCNRGMLLQTLKPVPYWHLGVPVRARKLEFERYMTDMEYKNVHFEFNHRLAFLLSPLAQRLILRTWYSIHGVFGSCHWVKQIFEVLNLAWCWRAQALNVTCSCFITQTLIACVYTLFLPPVAREASSHASCRA